MPKTIKRKYLPLIQSCFVAGALAACIQGKNNTNEVYTYSDSSFVIAYNVGLDFENDNYEVFTMNLDGSKKRNVTNLPGVEWTYLSVKDNLYFISDKDTCHRCYFLYKTNYQGENPTKITETRLADSWMSSRFDDTELIIKPHKEIDSVFHIIDLEGALIQRVETGLAYATDPLFVGDGKQIVFRGAQHAFKKDSGYRDELFVINDDGTGLRQLTNYPDNDTTSQWYNYHAGPPKWHPTEHFISYQSFQKGKYSLYAVNLDGTKNWKLTDLDESEGWHEWSPDGQWLAIELFDKNQTQFHIGLMHWQSKSLKILTDSTYKYQQSPNFLLKQ